MAMGVSGGEEGARRGERGLSIITFVSRAAALAITERRKDSARLMHDQALPHTRLLHELSLAYVFLLWPAVQVSRSLLTPLCVIAPCPSQKAPSW